MTYLEQINKILSKLEVVYGGKMDAEEYSSASIEECLPQVFADRDNIKGDSELLALHGGANGTIKDLAYLFAEAYYEGESVVLFDNFPNAAELGKILLAFTKMTYTESVNDALYKQYIAYLMFIDAEYIEFKFTNGYRCLKLVILMLMYKSTIHASLLSRFIIHQMGISVGVR